MRACAPVALANAAPARATFAATTLIAAPRIVLAQIAAVLLAAVLLAASSAGATVVIVPSLEEMANQADVIAHVKVGAPRVEQDEQGRIITLTRLEVVEAVKGAKQGELLEVFQVGGLKDGRGSWIAGAHRFAEHEELVFVGMRHGRGPGSVIPYGIGFGLFQVERDDLGAAVVELVGDVVTYEKTADGRTRQGHPVARRYDSLPAFLTMLRRATTLEEAPKLMQIERRPPPARKLAPSKSVAPAGG